MLSIGGFSLTPSNRWSTYALDEINLSIVHLITAEGGTY